MTATTTISKRRPYPYEAYVGPVKVMLEPLADGNLVSQKTKTLDATAPVDYTYDSADPYKERAFEWHELYGGFGQTTAPKGTPRRYAEGVKADLSIDGLWLKGPKFETHVETINAGAGEVRQFIQALHGGVLTVFAICENGVYRRTADGAWTASLTTGTSPALTAGHKPQQAIRFKHRGVSPVDALYVATSASNLWQYNGSTWSLAGATAGPGTGSVQGEARYIERVNDELWVGGDYWVVKVTDDPMVRANYSAVIYVGDQTAKITWLKQLGDTLFIWKEDGIYTVDTSGLDHELFPTLRGKNTSANGKNAAVWIDRVWFTYGSQTFTMTEDGVLKPDGTEQMLENTSTIHGTWSGGAGHNTWFFYELYYNQAIDTTFLVKHGTWVEENSTQATPGVAQFAEAHHGALYDWSKKATSIETVSGVHSTGNDRLYVGFLDGTCQWAVLPRTSPNPAEDTACFIGTTEIEGEQPQALSRRWYEGETVQVTTRSGQKLAGTPNHPILTQRGWVPLGQLTEEDYLFSRSSREEMSPANPHEQDRVPQIQEVFDLTTFVRSVVWHGGSDQQFHGDGQHTDVDVISTDSLLWDRIKAEIAKPGSQLSLSGSDESLFTLLRMGCGNQPTLFGRSSSSSVMRRPDLGHALLGSLSEGAQDVRLGTVPDRYAPPLQILSDVLGGECVATPEGLSRLPAEVRRDNVVSISRQFYAGHVYNLQTEGHWYFANNIIAHNCEFTSGDSYVYLPIHHSGFRADNKLLHAITAMGPRLTSTEWIEVEYRLDITNDLASWTKVSPDDPKFTLPSQRKSFTVDPVANPVFGKLIQIRVKLCKDPDLGMSPANLSPMIEGIVIHESIRPSFSREFSLNIKAGTFLARRDGLVDRRRGSDILDDLLQQCAQTGPINFLMPTGEEIALTIIDYKDSAASFGKRRDHEWLVEVQAIQLGTLSGDEAEIASGLTYRTLEQYTLGQLESIL